MPEKTIAGESFVVRSFLKLPRAATAKMTVSAMNPMKLRPNEMKSPGALM